MFEKVWNLILWTKLNSLMFNHFHGQIMIHSILFILFNCDMNQGLCFHINLNMIEIVKWTTDGKQSKVKLPSIRNPEFTVNYDGKDTMDHDIHACTKTSFGLYNYIKLNGSLPSLNLWVLTKCWGKVTELVKPTSIMAIYYKKEEVRGLRNTDGAPHQCRSTNTSAELLRACKV